MARRHQAGQDRVACVLPDKQQKAMADLKSRQALGDIGNVVTSSLPGRSFGAQLLVNAQAAAAAVYGFAFPQKKASETIREEEDGPNKSGAETDKHKHAINSGTSEVVIEISQGSNNERSRSRKPSRRKVHTFTSVLTARSKMACRLNNEPKELASDIDAADRENEFAVVEYVDDLYKFYKLSEQTSRPHDYMSSQEQINAKMRSILIDWLVQVHQKFDLRPETLFLATSIIDRYLSMNPVSRKELQLVGIGAMLIACKYEEVWAPEINDFIAICDKSYSREQILTIEKKILNKIEWTLTVPTPYVFLMRFLKAAKSNKEMENMVFFLAELALTQYDIVVSFCPSMVAASSVFAAHCTLNKKPLWTRSLGHHTGFSQCQLLDCAKMLVNCHAAASTGKLQAVRKKYSSKELGAVALYTSATKMLDELAKDASSKNLA